MARQGRTEQGASGLITIMNNMVALALLAGGVLFLVLGFNATNSFGSDVSRFFTGAPTDKAVWMLVGGVVLTLLGLGMGWRGRKGV